MWMMGIKEEAFLKFKFGALGILYPFSLDHLLLDLFIKAFPFLKILCFIFNFDSFSIELGS